MKKTTPFPMPRKRAFTLVEVLMTSIIIPLLLLIIFIVMNAGNEIYSTVTTSMDIRQSARNAMDRIVREVRESNSSTITILSTDSDHIVFTSPRFKDVNGIQIPLAYSMNSSGQIIREYPPNTLTPIAVNVTKLKFLKTTPQLDITIHTEKNAGLRPLSYFIKQKVRLRNE